MKKKLICTILILNLIFLPCYNSYAEAGSITIAGGTIGVGGLTGGALAGLAGPAVVAVFVGMMAVGIDVELTKQSQQAGMTKTEFVKSKIEQYCREAGKTADVFYKGITNGTSVLRDGSIAFSDATATQIKQFINWLFDSNQVLDNSQVGTSDNTVSLGNYNLPCVTQWSYVESNSYVRDRTSNNPVALVVYNNNNSYAYINRTAGTIVTNYAGNGTIASTNNLSSLVNGYYYYAVNRSGGILGLGEYGTSNLYNDAFITINGSIVDFLNSLDGSFDISGAGSSTDTFTGSRDAWSSGSNVFDPTQGWPTVVNPGVVGQIPIPADTDITVNVREYLEKLQEVLDQLKDRVIEGVDNADGIPKDWDIPDAVEANPTIRKQQPIPDSDRTPVTNDEPVNPSTSPTLATEPLKFDLRNIFPFCIPFDIKDMLDLLKAEPVAPQYTVDWDIPFVQENFTFTVNLSDWSDVAAVLRKMELLAFVIGLALVTRNLIRG